MEQNLEVGISAYANIQKLMAKRFDLLVDEKLNVFNIVNTHFPKWYNAIEVLSPPLQVNHLHLIISKENCEYQTLIDAFNNGLDEMIKNGTFESILAKYNFISDLQHDIE